MRRLMVCIHLTMLQQFVGINSIIIYATEITEAIVPQYKNLIPLLMNF